MNTEQAAYETAEKTHRHYLMSEQRRLSELASFPSATQAMKDEFNRTIMEIHQELFPRVSHICKDVPKEQKQTDETLRRTSELLMSRGWIECQCAKAFRRDNNIMCTGPCEKDKVNSLCGVKDTTIHVTREQLEKDLEEVAIPKKTTYMKYTDLMQTSGFMSQAKAARHKWDNMLNSEYIKIVTGMGLVKFFESKSDPCRWKRVEHNFYPSEEELEADDWYLL